MVRNAITVLIVDVVLLTSGFYVMQDLQWRVAYAASLHDACAQPCSYAPSFSYSILTRFFTMTGNGAQLVSPPTFDWVQLLALALVVVNVWFAYASLTKRRHQPKGNAVPDEGYPPKR